MAPTATSVDSPVRVAASRVPAFIGVARNGGMVFGDVGVSVIEALTRSGMNFTVVHGDIYTTVETPHGGMTLPMGAFRSTVRVNPDGTRVPLSIVKGRYTTIQNSDAMAFAQYLVDEYGANVVAAGEYGVPVGSRVFLALRLPDTLMAGGSDPHTIYVLVTNSHDGSSGLVAQVVAVRDSTQSQVATHIARAPQRYIIRHSGDVAVKFRTAHDTMSMVRRWVKTYESMTFTLLSQTYSQDNFVAFTKALLPTPRNASERSAQEWAARRARLVELFETAPECAFGRGTKFAAFMAVVEYADHHAPAKGDDPGLRRAIRSLDGSSDRFKARAWDLLTA